MKLKLSKCMTVRQGQNVDRSQKQETDAAAGELS